jgi:MOSC domain-containing protein YiiM
MEQVPMVAVAAGRGIIGDRYESGTGAYKKKPEVRNLSLISEEALERANQQGWHDSFTASDTRRNLVVSVDPETLNAQVDKEFTIGQVWVRGMELCTPCGRPSLLCGKPGFAAAFNGIGGLRVRILTDGEFAEGDDIRLAA